MPPFDDEPGAPPAPKLAHLVGEDVSRLSVDELKARVALLEGEIERLNEVVRSKSAQRDAAELFFKR